MIINAENIVSNSGVINLDGGLGGAAAIPNFPANYSSLTSGIYGNAGDQGGDGFIFWLSDQ